MLNIAPAYFVVNYSDVNCIVNKAATFFSFPIIVIKCAGAGSREPKQQAGLRLPCLASGMKGSVVGSWPGIRVRQEGWSPAQNSRVEDVGEVNSIQPAFPHFLLSFPPPANCFDSSSESCKLW